MEMSGLERGIQYRFDPQLSILDPPFKKGRSGCNPLGAPMVINGAPILSGSTETQVRGLTARVGA